MVIASFLSPEAEDTLATWLALFVIFVVPVVLIALFWMGRAHTGPSGLRPRISLTST